MFSHIIESGEWGLGLVGPHELLVGTRAVSYKLEVHAVCSFAQRGLHFAYIAYPTRIFKLDFKIRCCILIKWVALYNLARLAIPLEY